MLKIFKIFKTFKYLKSRQSTNWGCVRQPVGGGSPCKYVNAPSIRNQQAIQL